MIVNMEARRAEIMYIVTENGTVRVNDILSRFDEAPATIRRDLAYLVDRGAILHSHGEVRLLNPFPTRNALFSAGKLAIGTYAAGIPADGETIIIDSGTTTLALASQLVEQKKVLTVITNSLSIANTFATTDVVVIMPPGSISRKGEGNILGPDTDSFFRTVRVPKLFLAATGIDPDFGVTSICPIEASFKRAIINAADKVILLCDNTKFKAVGMNRAAKLSSIDQIVTNTPLEDGYFLQKLGEAGVELVYTD